MFKSQSIALQGTRPRIVRHNIPLFLLLIALLVGAGGQFLVCAQPYSELGGNAANKKFQSLPFQKSLSGSRNLVYGFKAGKFFENNKPIGLSRTLALDDPNETPHWLVGSYYSVEDGLTATLMLNNKGIAPIIVQPTLYSKTGQPLELSPVVVEANSFRYINLSDWISTGGESFRQGNIRLFHTGKDLVLGAQLYLVDESKSFSFEEKLAELGKFESRRLEGIWTLPSRRSELKVVLTNKSSNELTVTGRLTVTPNITSDPQSITLSPHETRVFDLEDFPKGGSGFKGKAQALSLEHAGPRWALIARAFVSERSTGYSNLVQFYNPGAGLMNEYHGAGIQMRSPSGERLKPIIVLRNTADSVATINGSVPYVRADGTNGSITLPTTRLQPTEIKLLNTSGIEQRNRQENIKFASIEITYDTAPGSVAVALHSESENRNFVSRVPLWDPLKQYTPTGGYPWLIEGTSVTKNYIKNITDRPQKYVGFYTWENGGIYMLGLNEVGPHRTVEIDVKHLRDDQIPDEAGRTIPQTISRGQFQWTLRPEDEDKSQGDPLTGLALIGRSEQIDWGKNVSNNYACMSCCVGNTIGSHLSPDSATVEVGSTVSLTAMLEEETCYGFPYSYQVSASWASNDTNIATVSSGTVTGQNVGNTTVNASYQGQRYLANPPCPPGEGPYLSACEGNNEYKEEPRVNGEPKDGRRHFIIMAPGCGECFAAGYYYAYESASINVVGTPNINEINPTGLVPGQSDVFVRIVGTNFGTSPTISVSGSGVTAVYDIQTPDGFDARFTVAEDAQVGQRQLTVSANGRTSNAVTFTVGDRTPVITSISRSSASTGQTFTLDINGQHFGLNPSISISPPGINCANNSATTTLINATCTVANNTSPGTRDIRVVSMGINGTGFEQVPQQSDTSNAVPFQVTTPQPVISEVGFVEKNGLRDVTLSFNAGGTPTSSDTVKLKLERTSGTGSATFEDGSTEATYTGTGGAPQTFRIKGVTESSQANNYKVQAEVNGSTSGQPSRDFTVAVISLLQFERINTTGTTEQQDVPFDNNPGVDGTHTTEEGQRIFPDKNTNSDATDRATIRVKATVAPASVPNLNVHYASFDLDDPSAAGLPIDTASESDMDNKGDVSGSKSGRFTPATGVTCTNASTGTSPLHISKIICPVSGTTTSTHFQVTMRPGDNFAVAASLVADYRDGIRVNTSAGANLINATNQVIPISGESNPNNVQGIRTRMLTVWRRLHVEVDSMGEATGNNASGNFGSPQTIAAGGNTTLNVTVTPALEANRFENGRLVITSAPPPQPTFRVVDHTPAVTANTANSVTITNTGAALNLTAADTFTLYDDDDFDDEDGATLNGDQGDNVNVPESTLMTSNDTLCPDTYTANNCNVFLNAYVRPVFDLATSNQDVGFEVNVGNTDITTLRNTYFQNQTHHARDDFWAIYALGLYQFEETQDGDPDGSSILWGIVDSLGGTGEGASVFLEPSRPTEWDVMNATNPWATRPVGRRFTLAHEVGHLFDARHEDYATGTTNAGLMAQTGIRTSPRFVNVAINKIRGGTGINHP